MMHHGDTILQHSERRLQRNLQLDTISLFFSPFWNRHIIIPLHITVFITLTQRLHCMVSNASLHSGVLYLSHALGGFLWSNSVQQ